MRGRRIFFTSPPDPLSNQEYNTTMRDSWIGEGEGI
jgi:hypothetical protein